MIPHINTKDFTVLSDHLCIHDFVGTDTVGCVRIPASFCGILGFRSSHGAVSSIGVLPNSQSLDTIGMVLFMYNSYKKQKLFYSSWVIN